MFDIFIEFILYRYTRPVTQEGHLHRKVINTDQQFLFIPGNYIISWLERF